MKPKGRPRVMRIAVSASALLLDVEVRPGVQIQVVVKDRPEPPRIIVLPKGEVGGVSSFEVPLALLVPSPEDETVAETSVQIRLMMGAEIVPITLPPDLNFRVCMGARLLLADHTKWGNLTLTNARATGSLPPRPSLRVMVFCNQVTFGGGKTKAVFQIARLLRDAGHHTCVTALWHGGRPSAHRFPDGVGFDFIDGSYKGSKEPAAPSKLEAINKRATAATEGQLTEYLQKSNFDAIYVPNFDSALYRIFKQATPQNTVLILGDHNPYRGERILNDNPHKDFVWAAKNFDAVHVVNPLIGELVSRLTERPVFTIPNPAATAIIEDRGPEYFRIRSIISTGRLVPTKRMDHVIRAFALLMSEFPGWTLDIFGSGELEESLKFLITTLGLEGRAKMRGFDPEVVEIMKSGALYVTGSAAEAHPLTIIEAMATGCLVISYDRQFGAKYLIRDGLTGFLAEDADIEALASVMRTTMQRIENEDHELLPIIRRARNSTMAFSDESIRMAWDLKVRELCEAKRAQGHSAIGKSKS